MKEKRGKKGIFAVLIAVLLIMRTATVFASQGQEPDEVPQATLMLQRSADIRTEDDVDVAVRFILDGVEAEDAGFVIPVPSGYEFTDTDMEDLLEAVSEGMGENRQILGLYWDREGTTALHPGDRIESESVLYVLIRTVEETPSPTPTPPDTDPTPAQPDFGTALPDDDSPQSPETTSPKTGDRTPAALYVSFLAAVIAVSGTVWMRKHLR